MGKKTILWPHLWRLRPRACLASLCVTRTGKPWSPNNTVPGSTRPCCWGSFPRAHKFSRVSPDLVVSSPEWLGKIPERQASGTKEEQTLASAFVELPLFSCQRDKHPRVKLWAKLGCYRHPLTESMCIAACIWSIMDPIKCWFSAFNALHQTYPGAPSLFCALAGYTWDGPETCFASPLNGSLTPT
jgi:hypothetical protein